MSTKLHMVLLALLITLGGCAQLDAWTSTLARPAKTAEPADDVVARADAVYINSAAAGAGRDFRNVYIAPVNLANMQIIQPEGGSADIEWWVTDTEDQILQQAITEQFTAALGSESAFYIVATPEAAQIVVNTAVVAIHPNVTRAASAAHTSPGGAITVSIALANAVSGEVMVRVVDTRSTDDIWAFNQVDHGDTGFNQIFRAWGDSIRLGMLQLQGRSSDALAVPLKTTQ
jgi:Protein of unknown function (DUF3313)